MKKTTPTFLSRLSGGRAACLAVALLGLLALQNAGAQQSLPFYEPFPSSDTSGEELGQDGTATDWTFGNSTSSSCARVEPYAALEYPGLTNIDAISQSYGLMSYQKDTSSTKNRAVLLSVTPGTTLYASCLLNILIPTNTTTWAFFGLSTSTNGTSVGANGATVYFNPAAQLQVSKNTAAVATNTTYSLTQSNTYLVVIRYKFNPGSPDQVDLWVNPTSLGNDGTIPPPTFTTTNGPNVTAFGPYASVAYFQNAAPTLFYLDEIRVAYDWAGVTPAAPAAGNIYNVTGGGSGCAGDGFAVGLSGSDSGVTYLLYTNGALTGESVTGTGSAVSFGAQTATALYTVLATNSATATATWMNTNASVTVLALPNIATEPVSATVATNGLCAFSVTSSGSGLNYQWYRNGSALSDGGHVSGSQTATLVISPATTADVATKLNGYYVIVANRCGNGVVSTTNALTLHAPATLVWSGDGVSNLWDVALSTNWNYSSLLGYNTNVFNYGDNVIFDDTSGNTLVNLSNVDLSPSSITINGSANTYTFSGNGLVGGGSIVMNSLSTLNLGCINNLTGGLIISNGTVAFGSPADLGFGPITLAGGILAPPGNGLVTVTNSIIITGTNSQIDINSPGGQPLVISSTPIGLGGTLTLENTTTKNAATANCEFTASNFTFNLNIDLNPGSGSVSLGGFNNAGSQIWNGLLTDSGGVTRNTAGGTTVLNNTNTYSGVTALTSGIIGVGADSVASSPPTVDAGPLGTGTLTVSATFATLELYASGGAHSIGNAIIFSSNVVGSPFIIGGSNSLTLWGGIDLSDNNRVFQIDNTAATVMSGDITDDGEGFGFNKTGAGTLYLDGASDFTGGITNNAGTLAGSGSLSGPLTVAVGATLGAGDAGAIPGTFTLNNGLALSGNLLIRVNKSQTQSNDVVTVNNVAPFNIGTGTLTINNTGPALQVGDSFTIFSQPLTGGGALTVTGGGAVWNNHLATDGGLTVTALAPSTPPKFISNVLNGTSLISAVSNGAAGSMYYVLASTNLTLPLTSWTPVATNTYPSGVFYITNTITPGTPKKFFILSPNP